VLQDVPRLLAAALLKEVQHNGEKASDHATRQAELLKSTSQQF
jgi:hypothetical protein